MGAHTTTDDPTRYRLAGELEAWKLRDPIERVKAYLMRSGATDASFLDDVEAEAGRLGARLREACRAMPDPSPLSAFEHIYAGPHPIVDAERQAYAAYLGSFDDEASTPVPNMAAERPAVAQARGTGGFERSGEA